jgi:NAD(P)-dependent dehydrogenase (short-subunit alcohol dehydrogenase family)
MDLTGKTAVVTGGTSGIGRAVALLLANRGAEVMVVGRDRARGAETEAALRRASGGIGAFLRADLSLLSSLLGRARAAAAEPRRWRSRSAWPHRHLGCPR